MRNFIFAAALVAIAGSAVSQDVAEPNAALRYWRAWAVIGEEEMERWNVDVTDIGDPEWEPKWTDGGPPEILEETGLGLHDNIRRLFAAINTEHCDFGIGRTPMAVLPHLDRLSRTGKLLAIRADQAIDEGKSVKAAHDVARCIQLARHCASDECAVSSMYALRYLTQAKALLSRMAASELICARGQKEINAALAQLAQSDPLRFAAGIEREAEGFSAWMRTAPRSHVVESLEMVISIDSMKGLPAERIRWVRDASDEAYAEAIAGYERYGKDSAIAFAAGQTETIEHLEEQARLGTYGRYVQLFPKSYRSLYEKMINSQAIVAEMQKLLADNEEQQ